MVDVTYGKLFEGSQFPNNAVELPSPQWFTILLKFFLL